MMAVNPARLVRLNREGCLALGAPADITIIDPNLEWTYSAERGRSRSRNSPFEGSKLTGAVTATIVGGRIVYRRAG